MRRGNAIYGRLLFHSCFLRLKFCVSTPFPAERMSPTDILRLLTSFSDWLELHNSCSLPRTRQDIRR